MDKYELIHKLGVGAQGSVWLCLDKENGRKVAIKFVDCNSEEEVKSVIREVDMLVRASAMDTCENFVKYYEHFVERKHSFMDTFRRVYVVMEYVEGGTLEKRLKELKEFARTTTSSRNGGTSMSPPKNPRLPILMQTASSRTNATSSRGRSSKSKNSELQSSETTKHMFSFDHRENTPIEEEFIEYTHGIINCLFHLHANKLIHRDIKPDNLLLFKNYAESDSDSDTDSDDNDDNDNRFSSARYSNSFTNNKRSSISISSSSSSNNNNNNSPYYNLFANYINNTNNHNHNHNHHHHHHNISPIRIGSPPAHKFSSSPVRVQHSRNSRRLNDLDIAAAFRSFEQSKEYETEAAIAVPYKYSVKLCDFGFTKDIRQDPALSCVGTPVYMAPEILENHVYNEAADIWSLGVVVLQMLMLETTGNMPDVRKEIANDPNFIVKLATENDWNETLSVIAIKCCNEDPGQRPTAEYLLRFIENQRLGKKNNIYSRLTPVLLNISAARRPDEYFELLDQTCTLSDGTQLQYTVRGVCKALRDGLIVVELPFLGAITNRFCHPDIEKYCKTACSNGLCVIYVDRLGISSEDYNKYTFLRHAKMIEELMDCLEIEKFSVIGGIYSGPFALACAQYIPDRVHSICIWNSVGFDTDLLKGHEEMLKVDALVLEAGLKLAPWLTKHIAKIKHGTSPESIMEFCKLICGENPHDQILFQNEEIVNKITSRVVERGLEMIINDMRIVLRGPELDVCGIDATVFIFHTRNNDHIVPFKYTKQSVYARLRNYVLVSMDEGLFNMYFAQYETMMRALAAKWFPRNPQPTEPTSPIRHRRRGRGIMMKRFQQQLDYRKTHVNNDIKIDLSRFIDEELDPDEMYEYGAAASASAQPVVVIDNYFQRNASTPIAIAQSNSRSAGRALSPPTSPGSPASVREPRGSILLFD